MSMSWLPFLAARILNFGSLKPPQQLHQCSVDICWYVYQTWGRTKENIKALWEPHLVEYTTMKDDASPTRRCGGPKGAA